MALLSAGVAFVEDAPASEPPGDELVAMEEIEAGPGPDPALDGYLANIDTYDSMTEDL